MNPPQFSRKPSREELDKLLEESRANNDLEGLASTDPEHELVRRTAHLKFRGKLPEEPDDDVVSGASDRPVV